MKVSHFGFAAITLGLLSLSSAALAHHSHGNYKVTETIEIRGTITKAHFANPHVWIFMDVAEEVDGETVTNNWAMEGGGLVSFKRTGWDSLRPGDDISVTCAPTRDDSHGCFMKDITVNGSDNTAAEDSGWTNMVFDDQFFSANFPEKPTISTAPYTSEYGGVFPSTRYEAKDENGVYTVTVVDFTDAEAIYEKLAETVTVAGAHNFWMFTHMGAVAYEAAKLREQGGEIEYDAWHTIDGVGGHNLFVVNLDGTRTYLGLYRHRSRLYRLDATVKGSAPPQGIFQQSLTMFGEDGERARYRLEPDQAKLGPGSD